MFQVLLNSMCKYRHRIRSALFCVRCLVFCWFSNAWQQFPNLDWCEHVNVFWGISIHFRFKTQRTRQQIENLSSWTRLALCSACKVLFWVYHRQEQFEVTPTISLYWRVPIATLHSVQIVTSSEGNNGKMSAKGEKNGSIVSGQYCYWRYYNPRAFFSPSYWPWT